MARDDDLILDLRDEVLFGMRLCTCRLADMQIRQVHGTGTIEIVDY